MRNLILILTLLFSFNSFGQMISSPMIPNLQVAGRTFTDLKNLKYLYQFVGQSKYQTLYDYTGVAYQVPAGKNLRILAVRTDIFLTSQCRLFIGYGDTAVDNSISGPINDVGFIHAYFTNSNNNNLEFATNFLIPAGKYVYIHNVSCTNSTQVYVYGYLE